VELLGNSVYNEICFWGRRIYRSLRYRPGDQIGVRWHCNTTTFELVVRYLHQLDKDHKVSETKVSQEVTCIQVFSITILKKFFNTIHEEVLTKKNKETDEISSVVCPFEIIFKYTTQIIFFIFQYQVTNKHGIPQNIINE